MAAATRIRGNERTRRWWWCFSPIRTIVICLIISQAGFVLYEYHKAPVHNNLHTKQGQSPAIPHPNTSSSELEVSLGDLGAEDGDNDASASAQEEERVKIDFALAGFSQCGIMTLAKTSNAVPTINFGHDGENQENRKDQENERMKDDPHIRAGQMEEFKEKYRNHSKQIDGKRVVNGFKSVNLLGSDAILSNFANHYPETDLVVAVRHPVYHFQSEYDFFFRGVADWELPSPMMLLGDCGLDCTRRCLTTKFCTHTSYFHH